MAERQMAVQREPPATASGARVLIVEDEAIIALGIERQLKQMGYPVVGVAGSGEEGLRLALARRPDLVLMDIQLGHGIDGVQAADAIRRSVGVPVVYLTAHSDPATLQRAKLAEPFGYVLKPYEERDLQTAIEIGLYRHRMEQRLRENEAWLAATLASIGDGVIATDDQGRVRFLNTLAERLTGWSQPEALGQPVTEVFEVVDRDRHPVANPALEALAHGRNATLAENAVLVARNGSECLIDDSAAPIRDVSGRVAGAVLVFRDVTDRRRLEEHLRQAQKMEAIGRLAGGIAHDFNNILTVILGTGELLGQRLAEDDESAEMLRQIVLAAQRAAAMTDQILAFSRKQVLQPTVLDLNLLVRDLGGMVKRLIGSHIELSTILAPDLRKTRADATQIGQIVLNLAANARDAMAASPVRQLTIRTDNVTVDAATQRLHPGVDPGTYVRLSVRDSGAGIPTDILPAVFEPFFTTKPVGEGVGLGLASVHGIVKQSGGHIEVSSTVGEGSTFDVLLPSAAESAPPAAVQAPRSFVGAERILLVDDDDVLRRMTKMALERQGYRVVDVGSGPEAVDVVERDRAGIDLLVTDLVMPRQSGRELAAQLQKARPELKVLFVSGHTDDTVLRQGVVASSANFLAKPFTLAGLAAKVRDVLDRPGPAAPPTSTGPGSRP